MLEKDKALRFEDIMQDEMDGRQPSWYYIYSTDDIDQGKFFFFLSPQIIVKKSLKMIISIAWLAMMIFSYTVGKMLKWRIPKKITPLGLRENVAIIKVSMKINTM